MPGIASTISSTSTCARLLRVRPLPNLLARQTRIDPKKLNTYLLRRGHRRGKFMFPPRDDYAGHAIPQDRDGGAPHIHELINRKQKKKRLHRQMKGSGRSEDN